MKRRQVIAGLVALLGAGATPGLGDAEMQPVIDQTGRSVTIPKRPQRVVSTLDVTITLPLYELRIPVVGSVTRSAEGTIFALDEFYNVTAAEAGIANIGTRVYDLEKITALSPDLIVAEQR